MLSQGLWFNKDIIINGMPIFYSDYSEKGINKIKHLINNEGNFKSAGDLSAEYSLTENVLRYQSIKACIKNEWKSILRENRDVNCYIDDTPCVIFGKKEIPISHLTSKIIYNHLVLEKLEKSKSNERLSQEFNLKDSHWKNIYNNLHSASVSNKVKELNFKILHGYVATNLYLYTIHVIESPRCNFCQLYRQSARHLFVECLETKNLWFRVSDHVKEKYDIELIFNPRSIYCSWYI